MLKGIIKSWISKDKKKGNESNNCRQKTTLVDWATRTPLETGGKLRCPRRMGSSYSTSATRCVTVKWHEYHLLCKSSSTPVFVNQYKQHK
jgi:hypothetical protein